MAIDHRILTQFSVPDTGAALSKGIANAQRIQQMQQSREEAPFRNQLLQQQVVAGEQANTQAQERARLTSIVTGLAELAPTIASGDKGAVARQLGERRARLISEGKPTNDTDEAFAMLAQPNGMELLQQSANEGMELGFKTGILNRGSASQLSAGQKERRDLISDLSSEDQNVRKSAAVALGLESRAVGSAAQTIAEEGKGELIGVSEGLVAEGTEAGKGRAQIVTEDIKQVAQINNKRIAELNQGGKARASSTKKAKQFLRAIKEGKAFTGATRSAASFIPGVFSTQAEFDEKFNAFAEVAARQKLKASGEIRPTDADVEGMKRAIFGIGRDEAVNIQLLEEFISDQDDIDNELDDLLAAKRSGNIGTFTKSVTPEKLGELDDEELFNF